jgi:hypothetical protein
MEELVEILPQIESHAQYGVVSVEEVVQMMEVEEAEVILVVIMVFVVNRYSLIREVVVVAMLYLQ